MSDEGWRGFGWQSWTDLGKVRARLDEGADPNVGFLHDPPLHAEAKYGSAEVVAELARWVDDVDAMSYGRTALWRAVAAHRSDNARVLVAAGADPLLEMMSGWSPARLSLTSPVPELPDAGLSLTQEEIATVEESRRLVGALGDPYYEGLGIVCVAGVDVAEAVRRLDAEVVDGDYDEMLEDPFDPAVVHTLWATDVPGGCVLAQPWGYAPQMPGVTKAFVRRDDLLRHVRQPHERQPGRTAVRPLRRPRTRLLLRVRRTTSRRQPFGHQAAWA
ncbi:ankyrin repeat domain-containing protein [Amycolatopsis sp. A1MSW2902]|uniref:ankyrin repeat domain-containing protein n=1 Tax=Amycolatopsis sp. A1MSW2902 TaxID=687413 RepID=UPI00307EB089